ncbi:MAG: protein kinase [Candidatus Margulisiibacteriota bacterium]
MIIKIPGMTIGDEIGRGGQSVVYKAKRGSDTYALKIFGEEAVRPFREAEILARIKHEGLPAVLEAGTIDDQPYVILEYIEGETLYEDISKGPLTEKSIVSIARVIAGALAGLHSLKLIHRDVKPQNIILGDSGKVKLIDFGLAAHALHHKEDIKQQVGTYLYGSPEQTGMLRRPVDARSDLYSLGIVLYECATGRPPYFSSKVDELLRQHITQTPAEVRTVRPDISPALSLMIKKLIAKEPDERYQSSQGLLYDLEHLDDLNSKISEGKAVELDSFVVTERFETPLIGRQKEIAKLKENWIDTKKGKGRFVLVDGVSGSGKTRLVHELINILKMEKSIVVSGKSTEEQTLPFKPFQQAVDEYLAYVNARPAAERGPLLAGLKGSIKEFAPLLKNFSPRMSELLGDVPAVFIENAQEVMFNAVERLFCEMASQSKGLLLFIDDVQWLDESSHNVISRLAGSVRNYPLMVVAAGRDDPANIGHIEALISELGFSMALRLQLMNFDEKNVFEMLQYYLGEREIGLDFVKQTARKTDGNPFVVEQYIRAALDAGCLVPTLNGWVADVEGIERLNLPSNVLQLMMRRIKELNSTTQQVLMVCALLGPEFSLSLLPKICMLEVEKVYDSIAEAYRVNLIERHGQKYRFLHDSIQEAILQHLDKEAIRSHHQRIAETLDVGGGRGMDYVYALALHYAGGETQKNPKRVYETNKQAGIMAYKNYAPAKAYEFLKTAIQVNVQQDVELEVAMGEICFQYRRLDEAKEHFNKALQLFEDPYERANIRARLALVHRSDLDTKSGIEEIEKGFKEIGRSMPKENVFNMLSSLGNFLYWIVLNVTRAKYGSSQGEDKRKRLTLMSLYTQTSHVAFFMFRPFVMLQSQSRLMLQSHLVGDSSRTSDAFVNLGVVVMAGLRSEKLAQKYIGRGIDIAKRVMDPIAVAHGEFVKAMVPHYLGNDSELVVKMKEAEASFGPWMDEWDYTSAIECLVWNLNTRGFESEAVKIAGKYIERLKAISSPTNVVLNRVKRMYFTMLAALAKLGRLDESKEYLDKVRDSWEESSKYSIFNWSLFLQYLLSYHLEKGDVGSPVDRIMEAFDRLRIKPAMMDHATAFIYVLHAYACLEECEASSEDDRLTLLKKLDRALKRLGTQTRFYENFKSHYLIICAGMMRLKGKHKKALKLLTDAEELADDLDDPFVDYKHGLEKANILKDMGNNMAARRQALILSKLAIMNGWEQRASFVRRSFGLVIDTTIGYVKMTDTGMIDAATLRLRRYLDALLKVSLASAAILDPEQQIRSALDEVVRILGAERAYLFLYQEDTDKLELKAGRDADGKNEFEIKDYNKKLLDFVIKNAKPRVLSGKTEKSIIAAPLMMRDKLVGVVYLSNQLARGVFTEEDVDILLAIANHIAIALETSKTVQIELERKALEKVKDVLAEKVKEKTMELKETYEKLSHAEKLAALGKLGGAIGHEVRTPLAVIKEYADLLDMKLDKTRDDEEKKYLDTIKKEVDKTILIVNDILNFVRIRMPELKPVDVGTLIKESAERMIPANVRVEYKIDDNLPMALADKTQLGQVFTNLIQNAFQAMPGGGTLKIIGLRRGDMVEVSFIDTGEGIPKENLKRIFELLYTTKPQGTGFGLSICHMIVEGFKGKIEVESEMGKGSTFTVFLPMVIRKA